MIYLLSTTLFKSLSSVSILRSQRLIFFHQKYSIKIIFWNIDTIKNNF